jgi:hypothetical protein
MILKRLGENRVSILHFPILRSAAERGIANKEAGPAPDKSGPVSPGEAVGSKYLLKKGCSGCASPLGI